MKTAAHYKFDVIISFPRLNCFCFLFGLGLLFRTRTIVYYYLTKTVFLCYFIDLKRKLAVLSDVNPNVME